MPPIVEYCLSGCDADLQSEIDSADGESRERRCLEHCGICRDRSFAVVDGRLVSEPELSSAIAALSDTGTAGEER